MLEKYYDYKEMAKVLLSRKDYKPFPKYEDREAWDNVNPEIRNQYLTPEYKKNVLDFQTTALTATAYMEPYRTGGKVDGKWSSITQPRRDCLWYAVLGECFEGKGEYIDKIIDLLWAISEESTWILPLAINHMHNHMYTGVMKLALPDVTEYNFIDLYSGICGGVLGWTYYFLKDVLDKESPILAKRIEVELTKRLIIPFMTHDDLTWFGFYGHKINNWNPWILTSIVPACLTVIKDEDYRIEFMARVMEKFDIYVNYCAKDGASDEGPGYWMRGGAACLDMFEIIYDATGGKVNYLNTEFAKGVGEYVAHANMTGDMYANFADSGMNIYPDYFIYRYAKRINSDYLKTFALSRKSIKGAPNVNDVAAMYRSLKCMFEYSGVPKEENETFRHKDVWLPDSQHLYVRSNDERVSLAAKGGYNNESHNHNDLGSFIYCFDGEPVLCDLGGPEYTAKTFSPFRYDYWIVNSTAHNCARIGRYNQHNGDEYKAKTLEYKLNDEKVLVRLDLKKAYEEEAGIRSYVRTFDFDKNTGELVLTDDILLEKVADCDVHFMTQKNVELHQDSVDILLQDNKKVTLTCKDCNISLERHYNIRKDEEHFESDKAVLPDGKKCECTRIIFTPQEISNSYKLEVRVTHN